MSITLKTLIIDGVGTEAKIIQIDTAEDYKLFQETIQRGTNLWPDAPAVIKTFADMVTSGKVLQVYTDNPDKIYRCNHSGATDKILSPDVMSYQIVCRECGEVSLPINVDFPIHMANFKESKNHGSIR